MERQEHKITQITKVKRNDLKLLKCPCCGANLPLGDNKSTTCSYCDVKIIFSNKTSNKLNKLDETVKQSITAPVIEDLDNEDHEKYTITAIEKNDSPKKLSDKKKEILFSLGVIALGGLTTYLSTRIYSTNNTFLLKWILAFGGLGASDLGILQLNESILNESGHYDKNGNIINKGDKKYGKH